MSTAQSTQAFTSLTMLQYLAATIGMGKTSSIPIIQDKKIVAHVMARTDDQHYTVQFWRKDDTFSFEAYARVPSDAVMKYNRQLKEFERRQPVIRFGHEVGYWSYGAPDKKTGWAKINGFFTHNTRFNFGDRDCAPYIADIAHVTVRLPNMMGQQMCRIVIQKGELIQCDKLAGFAAAADLALEYRMAHKACQPIILRHQIERFGGRHR